MGPEASRARLQYPETILIEHLTGGGFSVETPEAAAAQPARWTGLFLPEIRVRQTLGQAAKMTARTQSNERRISRMGDECGIGFP